MKAVFVKLPALFKSETDDRLADLGIEIDNPEEDIMDTYLSIHDITAFHETRSGRVNVYLGADMWTICMGIREFKKILELE